MVEELGQTCASIVVAEHRLNMIGSRVDTKGRIIKALVEDFA